MLEAMVDPNPFWGEITNMGVVERQIGMEWPLDDGGGSIELKGLNLALRQANRRP